MSSPDRHPSLTELLGSFAGAPPDRLDEEYRRLVDAVWDDGRTTDRTLPAIPLITGHLGRVEADRRGHLLILLGLLAEAEDPSAGEVRSAVRQGLDLYLEMLGPGTAGPLTLALLYLLAHFPDDRDRIMAAAGGLPLAPDDLTRLDRCLQRLDPDDAVLGRVWPSPHQWALSEAEREFDRGWVRSLTPAQLTGTWQSDTRMVQAYSGLKARWAVRYGMPAAVADAEPYRDIVTERPAGPPAEVFERHREAVRCPSCGGRLSFERNGARCGACPTRYAVRHGVLDLSGGVVAGDATGDDPDDVLQNAAVLDTIGHYYETVLRPAFLQVMGGNWDGAVTPADEDRYLLEHTRPVDGPLLDIAAGAGRWTAVLSKAVGPERLIALDLNTLMLTWLRKRLPTVAAIRASALTLPFADATLGAVNCWNALQALPDPEAAIAEVGRCLRPGGTFTLLTFRWAADPVDRYFQAAHAFPGFPDGLSLFGFEQIRGWLNKAGMSVRDERGPGTFVFITAERNR